jgi:hypothetical protein
MSVSMRGSGRPLSPQADMSFKLAGLVRGRPTPRASAPSNLRETAVHKQLGARHEATVIGGKE